jgi:uncharacterized protein (TIGR03067 family)
MKWITVLMGVWFLSGSAMALNFSVLFESVVEPNPPKPKQMKMNLKGARGFTMVSLLLPCVLPGLQTGCTTHRPTAAQLQPLQGTWEESKAGEKVTVTITGNSLDFHRDSNFWFKTRFTLPTGKDPQQLHATIKGSSSPKDSNGKVVVAIFKIEDGTLTLAAEPQNGSKTFEESSMFHHKLRKVQPQEKLSKHPHPSEP